MRRLAAAFAISALLPLSGCIGSFFMWNNWREHREVAVSARVETFDRTGPMVVWQLDRRVGLGYENHALQTVQFPLSIGPDECGPGDHPAVWAYRQDNKGPHLQQLSTDSLVGVYWSDAGINEWEALYMLPPAQSHCDALAYWFYEPRVAFAPSRTIVLVVGSASGQLWSDERIANDFRDLPPLWVWPILPFTFAIDTALFPIELLAISPLVWRP